MIGAVIGPGGKIIQEIQAETETTISIDEADGKGIVEIASADKSSLDAAEKRVKDIVFPPTIEIGEVYEGPVKSVVPYGAFVEIFPGQDGLLHVSELEWRRVENVSDVLKEGDVVKFKVTGRDPKTGKVKLSRKVLLPKPERSDNGQKGGGQRNGQRDGQRSDHKKLAAKLASRPSLARFLWLFKKLLCGFGVI